FDSFKAKHNDSSIHALGLGIGLHTGEAAIGNVGSERVMSYTVIGDTVNIARRLQQQAPSGTILLSQSSYEALENRIAAKRLAPLKLLGRNEPVTVYQVLSLK